MLEVRNVAWYAPNQALILDSVNFELAPGELAWLSGPSGGGKSSLLRLMNRLAEPSGGRITFRGKPLEQWDPPVLRRRVALLPQSPVVLPGSVGHNLRLPFSFKAGRERPLPSEDRLERLLAGLGLEGLGLGQPVTGLSLGQKQRLALARMLLLEPEVLLLDEPVSALDPESRALVEQTAVAQAGQGRAVLLVSHHPPENAGPARCLVLSGGRLEELS
jgi:putative ABC transport system ATP-binding protein